MHALKSSARLIGALELGDEAQLLENAGKEDDVDYIKAHHAPFMEEYKNYKTLLSGLFGDGEATEDSDSGKPVADQYLMESIYEGMHDAADAMDYDALEGIIKEIEGYAIPDSDKEKFKKLCDMAGQFDYDGIIALLDEKG